MRLKFNYLIILLITLLFAGSFLVSAQKAKESSDLKNWPKGCSPQEVGKRVADHFTIRPLPVAPRKIPYPEVCTWYGALTFARLTNDKQLAAKLEERFQPLFGIDSVIIPVPNHVDNTVFGGVPFELFILTKDQKYLMMAKKIADKQWEAPQGTRINPSARRYYDNGLTPQTRMWIDENAEIHEVCEGTNKKNDRQYYFDRKRNVGDLHGQAPVLWCVSALLR